MKPILFSSGVFFLSLPFVSAGDFKFAKIQVEVEKVQETSEKVAKPTSITAVPTRVKVVDARNVSEVVFSKVTPPVPIQVAGSSSAVSGDASSEKKELPSAEAKPPGSDQGPRPVLIAPLADVDLSKGAEVPVLEANPFSPPYVPPAQNQVQIEDPGVLPLLEPVASAIPRATPVFPVGDVSKMPIQKALELDAPFVEPPLPVSGEVVSAKKVSPQQMPALAPTDLEDSYYSEMETDALISRASGDPADNSWRFVRPVVGDTW